MKAQASMKALLCLLVAGLISTTMNAEDQPPVRRCSILAPPGMRNGFGLIGHISRPGVRTRGGDRCARTAPPIVASARTDRQSVSASSFWDYDLGKPSGLT